MTTDPTPAATLAALIWEASRRDEGTISALGADVVAAHLLRELPGLGDALTANGPGAGRGTIAAPASEPVRYEYVLLLPDGRRVGSGPTLDREAVVSDYFAWAEAGYPGIIERRLVNGWEPDPDGVPTPRIPEPGLLGVVEAACLHNDTRREWFRTPNGWWPLYRGDDRHDWDSLIDPVLVREGIR